MIIKKIRIGNFGKFTNKEIDFCAGLNVIYGENETGKSTLHAFIKAMLFGIEIKRGSAAKDDVYSRYLPWDAPGAFSGSMDFEHEGVNYRIARTFLKNVRSCTCTNLDLGREITLADDKITSLIPEMNESNYFNTVVVGQQSARTEKILADNVGNYIANLALAKTGEVDIPGALDILKKKQKAINAMLAENDIEELNRWMEELNSNSSDVDDEIKDVQSRVDVEKSRCQALEDSIKSIEEKYEAEKLQDNNVAQESDTSDYDVAVLKINSDSDKKLEDISAATDNNILSLKNEAKAKLSKLDLQMQERLFVEKSNLDSRKKLVREKREAVESKRSEIDTQINKLRWSSDEKRKEIEQIKKERAELEPLEESLAKRKGAYKNQSVIGTVALVIGGILAYFFSGNSQIGIIAGLVLMAVGVVVVIIGMIKSREMDQETEKSKTRIEELGNKERELQAGVMEANAASDNLEEDVKKLSAELEELKDRETSSEHNFEKATLDAEAEFALGKNGVEMELQRLEAEERLNAERKISEVKSLREQELAKLNAEKNAARERKEREQLMRFNREKEYLMELKEKQTELEGCNRIIDMNMEQLTALREKADDLFEKYVNVKRRIAQAVEQEESAKVELAAIELAQSTISRMSELIYDSFGRQLNEMLSSLAGKLTNGKYTQVIVNKDLSLKFMGSLDYQSANGLSAGTMEQLYLALRLSIGELFFGNSEVPVILDEPFAYYDEKRAKAALDEMLDTKKQILLFTCRHLEDKMLKEMNADFGYVELV